MNLFLHGIGTDHKHPVVSICDSLESRLSRMNPWTWFLRIRRLGRRAASPSSARVERPRPIRFLTSDRISGLQRATNSSTSSSTFTQCSRKPVAPRWSSRTMFYLKAAPAKRFAGRCSSGVNVHTLLRLPTGIWYSAGVKANVLFFDKKPAINTPATKEVWVYDLRSNQKFSLRQNQIRTEDLTDFIQCYRADDPTRAQGNRSLSTIQIFGDHRTGQSESRHPLGARDDEGYPERLHRQSISDSRGCRPGGLVLCSI